MSVWPPNASFYASSTCVHLRLLAGPFDQGLTVILSMVKITENTVTVLFKDSKLTLGFLIAYNPQQRPFK